MPKDKRVIIHNKYVGHQILTRAQKDLFKKKRVKTFCVHIRPNPTLEALQFLFMEENKSKKAAKISTRRSTVAGGVLYQNAGQIEEAGFNLMPVEVEQKETATRSLVRHVNINPFFQRSKKIPFTIRAGRHRSVDTRESISEPVNDHLELAQSEPSFDVNSNASDMNDRNEPSFAASSSQNSAEGESTSKSIIDHLKFSEGGPSFDVNSDANVINENNEQFFAADSKVNAMDDQNEPPFTANSNRIAAEQLLDETPNLNWSLSSSDSSIDLLEGKENVPIQLVRETFPKMLQFTASNCDPRTSLIDSNNIMNSITDARHQDQAIGELSKHKPLPHLLPVTGLKRNPYIRSFGFNNVLDSVRYARDRRDEIGQPSNCPVTKQKESLEVFVQRQKEKFAKNTNRNFNDY